MSDSKIILASSSKTRKELLERLGIKFDCHSPDVDESTLPQEAPQALVTRLAENKAQALQALYPQHLIIGADTIAWHQNKIIGKPADFQQAVTQLLSFSNTKVSFYTGLSVINTINHHCHTTVELYEVYFRSLTREMVENYVTREKPYHCAGSIKAEGLASVLFERLSGNDFTALLGLPLIQLTKFLELEGFKVI